MSVFSSSEPRRYLIAIGSPYCPKMGLDSLKRVETDIEKVVKLFTSETQGYERVLEEHIELGDTAQNIKHTLSRWFSSPERNASDCVIVYYAGHGDDVGNFGSHYLLTLDSVAHNLSSTAIETSELVKCFFEGAGERSANILLILDVCYAGQGGDQLTAALSKSQNVIKGSGFWIISSVDSRTAAADGAFVDALEEAFQDFTWMSSQDEFLNPHNFKDAINDCLKSECLKKKQAVLQAEINVLRSSTPAVFIRNSNFKRHLDDFLEARQEKSNKLKNELKEILQRHNTQFDKMQQAYQGTVKAWSFRRRSTLETSESLITELLKIPKGQSKFTALEEFAAWLTDSSTNDDLINSLQRWGEEHCKDWSNLLRQVKAKREEQYQKVQMALLIMINYSDEAATQSQDGEVYRIQVWLIKNVEQYKRDRTGIARLNIKSDLTGDKTYSWEKIPEILKEILKAGNVVNELSEDSEVHVFLPQHLLNCDVDGWELLDRNLNFLTLLGREYQVFIRMSQRLGRDFDTEPWKTNWEQQKKLIQEQERASNVLMSCHNINIPEIENSYKCLRAEGNKNLIGLKLTKAPYQNEEDIFNYIFRRGFPLGIWTRFDLSDNRNKDELERILATCIGDLPHTIKQERLQSFYHPKDSHIGHHLSLLWDDPELVPPKSA